MKWQTLDWDECPICGDSVEVKTSSGNDNAHDGDEVRCLACRFPGQLSVCEGEWPYVDWHDEEDCECEHCLRARQSGLT